jgi:hypothetical protein
LGFGETTSEEIERVASAIVDSAFKVHTRTGPGLLESAYRTLMIYELRKRNFEVTFEVPVPLIYDDVKLDAGYRLDLLVNNCVIVEDQSSGQDPPRPRGATAHVPEAHRHASRLPDQLQYETHQKRYEADGTLIFEPTASCPS